MKVSMGQSDSAEGFWGACPTDQRASKASLVEVRAGSRPNRKVVRQDDKEAIARSFPTAATTAPQSRRRSAAVSRKISRTHRYQHTSLGRQIIAAVLAASNATVNTFIPKAA